MHYMRSPEPARTVTDAVPPVIAAVLEHEGNCKSPPGEGNMEEPVGVRKQDPTEEQPAQHAPQVDTSQADHHGGEGVAHLVVSLDTQGGGEQDLQRDEQHDRELQEIDDV